MELSLTRQLLIDIAQFKIGDQDRQRAALHVLDWIGCAFLGSDSVSGGLYKQLLDVAPKGNATAIKGKTGYWQDVLQHNAALGNVLEMDDIHRTSILHPGPVVIPTALALAEQHNASMNDFLDAVIKGYEATIRIGEAVGRSHYQFFHNTSTCAAFGSAMAAASVLELDISQSVWALGNAGSRTGGVWQMRNEKVMTKQWHNAEAARSGAMAATMAKQGLTGPEYILEGPHGLFAATSTDAEPERVIAPCKHWKMFDCSFKPWPACRHAHPAIDTLLSVMENHKVEVKCVERVDIFTYKDALLFCDNPCPQTELQAKFSIQHALSAILCWGRPALEHYLPEAYNHPDTLSKRKLIHLHLGDTEESNYPQHYGATCVITLENGRQLEVQQRDTLGDPERPLTPEQVIEKARMLLSASQVLPQNIEYLTSLKWAVNESMCSLTKCLGDQDNQ